MTKLRAPVSIEQALTSVGQLIGWAGAGELVGQAERTVRNWSDPDTPAEISLKQALALDTACLSHHGLAPLRDTYLQLLDERVAQIAADWRLIAEHTAVAAKEGGEMLSALVLASQPDATPATKLIAAREVEDLMAACKRVLPHLRPCSAEAPPSAPEVPPPRRESG